MRGPGFIAGGDLASLGFVGLPRVSHALMREQPSILDWTTGAQKRAWDKAQALRAADKPETFSHFGAVVFSVELFFGETCVRHFVS